MRLLSIVLLYSNLANADDLAGAFRDLGNHYYKGSRLAEEVDTIYRNLPIELKTTLGYFGPLQQIFVEQRISIVITFP